MEFTGEAVRDLSMEGRMTLSNMAIEVGAKAGMIAPDETTFAYLKGRTFSPKGKDWDEAVEYWKTLRTDEDAVYDKTVEIDVSNLAPQVTWGTNPGQVMGVDERVPVPADMTDPVERAGAEAALRYTELKAADSRHPHRHGLHRLLHERAHRRLPRGGRNRTGPQGRTGRAGACRPRERRSEAPRRRGGLGQGLQGRGL